LKVFGKPNTKYGVTAGEVEQFSRDVLVKDWLNKYGGNTKKQRAHCLCRYFKWLKLVQGMNCSPADLLNEQVRLRQSDNIEDRRRHLQLAMKHTRNNPDFADLSEARRYALFSGIKNFYDHHEVPLTTAKNVYGSHRKYKYPRRRMDMTKAIKILGLVPQRERAILLVQLQSGMEIGAVLNKFNYMWDPLVFLIKDGAERIKVELQNRKNMSFPYFTYVSRDAVQELRKWLVVRKKLLVALNEKGAPIPEETISRKPIFITEDGTPYKLVNFYGIFKYHLRRAKLWRGNRSVVSHMFRGLFKTEASPPDRGIEQRYIEFFLGHISGVEAVGAEYDGSPEVYEPMFEREYAKLEPYINPYSGTVERGVQDRKLEKEIEELKQIVETLVERSEEWKEKLRE
jgi:hypothetical protein